MDNQHRVHRLIMEGEVLRTPDPIEPKHHSRYAFWHQGRELTSFTVSNFHSIERVAERLRQGVEQYVLNAETGSST